MLQLICSFTLWVACHRRHVVGRQPIRSSYHESSLSSCVILRGLSKFYSQSPSLCGASPGKKEARFTKCSNWAVGSLSGWCCAEALCSPAGLEQWCTSTVWISQMRFNRIVSSRCWAAKSYAGNIGGNCCSAVKRRLDWKDRAGNAAGRDFVDVLLTREKISNGNVSKQGSWCKHLGAKQTDGERFSSQCYFVVL